MSDYRRWRVAGGTYFFTLVTHERRPFLTTRVARRALWRAFRSVRRKRPFELIAVVLLPDHLHVVCAMPSGDADYSTRLKQIKETFTRNYLQAGGVEGTRNQSRIDQGERAVWQRRFWEHTIESEEELDQCVDYTHYNPAKHGYVTRVCEWKWPSFHRFVAVGHYDRHWGASDPTPGLDMGE
jgi:putative transposase